MLLNKEDIPHHPWLVEFQNHTRHESLEWENSPIFYSSCLEARPFGKGYAQITKYVGKINRLSKAVIGSYSDKEDTVWHVAFCQETNQFSLIGIGAVFFGPCMENENILLNQRRLVSSIHLRVVECSRDAL